MTATADAPAAITARRVVDGDSSYRNHRQALRQARRFCDHRQPDRLVPGCLRLRAEDGSDGNVAEGSDDAASS